MEKMKMGHSLFLFFSLCFILAVHFSPATAQEVEDETEFSYDLKNETGPLGWGKLHPEWGACENGTMQSPIDLSNERVQVVSYLGKLKRGYKASKATLKNRGHDMMLKWESEKGAGYIRLNGTEYRLKQCHWHSPSEHTLNGEGFALELHMVHESSDGKIAVVGIMYKIGRPDSFLWELRHHLEAVEGNHEKETPVGLVNPKRIKIGSRKYYRYMGSLTTPPCTQGVVWTIVRKVRTVTREQVRSLRVAVHDHSNRNSRPVQALNERMVKLYRPEEEGRN